MYLMNACLLFLNLHENKSLYYSYQPIRLYMVYLQIITIICAFVHLLEFQLHQR